MTVAVAILLVYLLPGFGAAAIFSDRTRWNPVVWLWGSFTLTPILLSNLGTLGIRGYSAIFVVCVLVAVGGIGQLAGWLCRRYGFGLRLPPADNAGTRRWPYVLAVALGIALTLCVLCTRTTLLKEATPSLEDDWARISTITAVAVSGVPPRHYLFPQVPLSYYYYDFVLPGLLVGLTHPALSVRQAFVIHLAMQTTMLAATTVALAFRLCPKPWTALAAVFFLTFGGGFDFWIALATGHLANRHIEWWAEDWVSFYRNAIQISLPSTLAVWVPQHHIAGYVVLLGAALISCVEGDRRARLVLLGLLLAFVAGCSVFVAMGLGAGMAMWMLLGCRNARAPWGARDGAVAGLIAVALSLVLLDLYLGKDPTLSLNYGDVAKLAGQGGSLGQFAVAKLQVLPRFLLYFFIDSGVSSLLFFAWLWLDRSQIARDPLRRWVAMIGIAFLPIFYLFRSINLNDLAMRGIIPAQFAWALGGAWALSRAASTRWRLPLLVVAIAGTLGALPSSTFQIYGDIKNNQEARRMFRSVRWINEHTPLDAVVLFVMRLDRRHHVIERQRLMNPAQLKQVPGTDRQYFQRPRLAALPRIEWDIGDPTKVCAIVTRLQPGIQFRDVYLLEPADTLSWRVFGKPVYRGSEFVLSSERELYVGPVIYHVHCREGLGIGEGSQPPQ